MKYIFIVLLLIFSTFASAEESYVSINETYREEGLSFFVRKATIDKWLNQADEPSTLNRRLDILALSLDINNSSKTRKIDLDQPMNFSLSDEFDNQYKILSNPIDYDAPIIIQNEHYPSLYPGEIYTKTIFFEAPIESSSNLFLTISIPDITKDDVIQLRIPRSRIVDSNVPDKWRSPTDEDLIITQPRMIKSVHPGDSVHVEVELSKTIKVPDSIFVLTPIYVFEDKKIAKKYDIKIPEDQDFGNFEIGIMASWTEANREVKTISKTITLKVVDPAKECIDDCIGPQTLLEQ